MKKLILILPLFLVSCLEAPATDSTATLARVSDPAQVAPIEGFDGTYRYYRVTCHNADLTTEKIDYQQNYYEELTINGNALYSKVGYLLTDKFIEVVGTVSTTDDSISFQNMQITSISDPAWIYFAPYRYGMLSYPVNAGNLNIAVGNTFADVDYQNIEQDSDGNLVIELAAGSYNTYDNYAAYQSSNPTDRCFMHYERQP